MGRLHVADTTPFYGTILMPAKKQKKPRKEITSNQSFHAVLHWICQRIFDGKEARLAYRCSCGVPVHANNRPAYPKPETKSQAKR
jgi:hypothetical protein